MKSTKFIILTTQRSGSTWVVDMLNSHPEITAFSELMLDNARGRPKWGGEKEIEFWNEYSTREQARCPEESQPKQLERYLDRVFAFNRAAGAVGFKLMYGQLGAFPEIWNYAVNHDVAFIHLVRANFLDVLISRELAYSRDVHHTYDREVPQGLTIRLETADLLDRLTMLENDVYRFRERLRRSTLKHTEATYENLAQGTSSFAGLLGFLGVKAAGVTLDSPLQRIVTCGQAQVVENHAQVAAELAGTRFQNLLERP